MYLLLAEHGVPPSEVDRLRDRDAGFDLRAMLELLDARARCQR